MRWRKDSKVMWSPPRRRRKHPASAAGETTAKISLTSWPGSYYTLKDNFTAKLLLNNKGPKPIEVLPTLFSMSGEKFEAPAVIVDGNTHQFIDLADWAAAAGEQFREGSLQLFHRGRDLVLGAQIYLTDDTHSLSFEEKLSEPTMAASSRLAGVWWLPSPDGAVSLVLSNTTDAVLSVSTKIRGASLKGETSATIDLQPHETKVLDLKRDVAGRWRESKFSFGAIYVEHNGPRGGVLARAMAHHAAAGYSLPIQFYDPRAAKSKSLQGAGLRVGKAGLEPLSPKVVAHNAGDTETTLSGRVPYTRGDGSSGVVSLPTVHLSPGETQVIDIGQSLRAHGVQREVAAAGLEIEYTSEPGSVVTSAFSVSRSGNQVFRVPLWDIAAQRSATGGYPWYIEGDSSTIVYIKNVTDEPQQYTLQLRYDSGVYSVGLKTVEPRQTVALDVRALRDQQIPDERGHAIPLGAESGQINWSLRGPRNQVLIGRSEQADIARGTSSNYACMNCCPDSFSGGWVVPDGTLSFVGDETQFTAFEQTVNCYGSPNAPYSVWPSWDSTNWYVASCEGNGLSIGQNPGLANIQARWDSYGWSGDSGNPNECIPSYQNILASALTEVLNQDVLLQTVSFSDKSADFAAISRAATLDIGSAIGGSAACSGGSNLFTIVIDFDMPVGADSIRHPDARTFVSDEENQQFIYTNFGFQNVNFTTRRAQMWIRLQRGRPNAPSNRVGFTISGTSSGQTGLWNGGGRVHLVCP